MGNFFAGIYDWFSTRKAVFYLVFAISCIVPAYLASKVTLEQDIMQMLPGRGEQKELAGFLSGSGFTDRIMIAVSVQDTANEQQLDSAVAVADMLAESLGSNAADYIK